MFNTNKFGVEYHGYTLALADGREIVMDVGYEEDWGNVQPCTPDDCPDWQSKVGWGNDADGHTVITDVFDVETEDHLDPVAWFENEVAPLVYKYSA